VIIFPRSLSCACFFLTTNITAHPEYKPRHPSHDIMKTKRKSPAANQTGRSTTPATAPNVTQDTYETEDDQSVEGDLRDENGKLKEISCDTLDIEGQDFEDASSAVRPHDLPAHISLGAPVQTCQTLPIEYTTAATLGIKYPNFINWYKKTINKQVRTLSLDCNLDAHDCSSANSAKTLTKNVCHP
jgi:hypothetical protein